MWRSAVVASLALAHETGSLPPRKTERTKRPGVYSAAQPVQRTWQSKADPWSVTDCVFQSFEAMARHHLQYLQSHHVATSRPALSSRTRTTRRLASAPN